MLISKPEAPRSCSRPLGLECTLRYSATHTNKQHMVYRLDAVDAYERKLVKQIEVASLEVEGGHNKAFGFRLDFPVKKPVARVRTC